MRKGISLLIYNATRDVAYEYAKHLGALAVVAAGILFLAVNIFFSQNVHPLYYRVTEGRKEAVVFFLQKIQKLPVFPYFLSLQSGIHGPNLEVEVYKENIARKEKIDTYQALLKKNPASRDLLYALSQLYFEDGQLDVARQYFLKAQKIDPEIK